MSGAFITVEGGDGSGKTTHIAFLAEQLVGGGVEVVCTREPGGTELGAKLREILLAGDGAAVAVDAELLLFFADRAQHIAEVIRPALAAGKWVLSDRFTDATYAYQGGGRGLPQDHIATLETLTQGGLQPDLTLLLDVSPAVAQARITGRDAADKFDQESLAFSEAVRKSYLQRARKFPDRITQINADKSIAEVQKELAAALASFRKRRR